MFTDSGCIRRPESWTFPVMIGIRKSVPPTTLDDFRYVALSAVLSKWFLRAFIFLWRNLKLVLPRARRVLTLGYSPNMSTTVVVDTLRQAMRYAYSLGLPICVASLDIFRCFEYLRHADISDSLKDAGLPCYLERAIMREYEGLVGCAKVGDSEWSELYPIECSGRTGGVETPDALNAVLQMACGPMVEAWEKDGVGFLISAPEEEETVGLMHNGKKGKGTKG